MPPPLIIIGASTRAAAQSALRAGFEPHCIDLFADRDLVECAHVVRCPFESYPYGIPAILFNPIHDFPEGPVLLTGSMENHLDTVAFIARRRTLFGPSAEAIRECRNPYALHRLLAGHPIAGISPVPVHRTLPLEGHTPFVRKPLHSSAGHGITLLKPGVSYEISDQHYFQPYIQGIPISAQFHSGQLLGATHQIVGDLAFGATHSTQYVGNIAPLTLTPGLQYALTSLGTLLAHYFQLGGLFGVDFILDPHSQLHPVEINPRYTASIELLERAHQTAYLTFKPGALPEESPSASRRSRMAQEIKSPSSLPSTSSNSHPTFHAKAILYATRPSVIPDLFALFPKNAVADVPPIGSPIPAGRPVCTLLSAGQTHAHCISQLHDMATYLYTRL